MKRRRWWRWALWGALLLVVLVNVVAFNHAWRFTHFSAEPGAHTPNPEELSALQKLQVLALGIKNPKPKNGPPPKYYYQAVSIQSPNGKLESWYSPVENARGTVALFHGFAADKSKLLYEATYFRNLGYCVLLTDFAGNGGSEGHRTTVGYREADDVAAVARWQRERQPELPLVLYGVSMGAVAILRAESELNVRPAANILECPYGSMRETAYNRFRSMHVPPFPLADLLVFWGGVQNDFWAFGLNARRYARNVTTPTLLMWGDADPRVLRPETDAIYAALAGPKQRQDFAGLGHEPYWHWRPKLWRGTIRQFLTTQVKPPAPF